MHNGTTLAEVDETVQKVLDPLSKYEVRVQIVRGPGVVLHTFPREMVINSQTRPCLNYEEALAVYEDACKQLGEKL